MKHWITKDGTKIKVSGMTNSHLANSIVMLKKHLKKKPPHAIYMGNSTHAEDAVDQENRHNELVAEEVAEKIEVLEKELNSRELTQQP